MKLGIFKLPTRREQERRFRTLEEFVYHLIRELQKRDDEIRRVVNRNDDNAAEKIETWMDA